jgi:hypothetical protein
MVVDGNADVGARGGLELARRDVGVAIRIRVAAARDEQDENHGQ